MKRLGIILGAAVLCASTWFTSYVDAQETVVFSEDFESGWGFWEVSNGVWEIGAATGGPSSCHGGGQCAGTVLAGNYDAYTDSRLLSPLIPNIDLPAVAAGEEIWLRFWNWFSYSSYDSGQVQISVYDAGSGTWGAWESLGTAVVDTSGAWSLKGVDLTAYAGEQVRIGFLHVADRPPYTSASESSGWYIDDLQVIKKAPEFTGDFELGWEDWVANRGVWEVGTPTAGPGACHAGSGCAGTVLNGNYPAYTDSVLVSPSIELPQPPPNTPLFMSFWEWFSYSSYDYGQVLISEFDPTTETWLPWQNLGVAVEGASIVWTKRLVVLTPYAGKVVHIGFLHVADRPPYTSASESSGWYIDNIRLPGVALLPCEGDFDNDGDVDGTDLGIFSPGFGRVDCSLANFCDGDFDGDGDVDGTDLGTFSADFGRTDCFMTDPFE